MSLHRPAHVPVLRHLLDSNLLHAQVGTGRTVQSMVRVSLCVQDKKPCWWRLSALANLGVEKFGFADTPQHTGLEAMWHNYTVFTVVRNPFARAGSSYDFILKNRVRGRIDLIDFKRSARVCRGDLCVADVSCRSIASCWCNVLAPLAKCCVTAGAVILLRFMLHGLLCSDDQSALLRIRADTSELCR